MAKICIDNAYKVFRPPKEREKFDLELTNTMINNQVP